MRGNRLATRQIVLVTGIVAAAVLVICVFSFLRARSAFEGMLRSHGRILLGTMEDEVGEYLIRQDFGYLRLFVSRVTSKEPVVSWLAVVGEDGVVVAHSDHAREGTDWRPAGNSTGAPPSAPADRLVRSGNEKVLELVSPVRVGDKSRGTLLLGLNFRLLNAELRRLSLSIALAGILIVLLAALAARPLTAGVTTSLSRLVRKAEEISGGELRTQAPEEGHEEFRALARAFNTMAGSLRTVLQQIQEAGGAVGEFSSSMTGLIHEQATSAAQQAASLSQVTTTMEELSRTSHQIAGSAESVKESAARTVERAQHGTTLVRESVEGMGTIKERVSDIAQKTRLLGEKSREIGKVMDLIKEVAGEIHLLALNAAIESAAAGEHGRRFAVVASEVRRLAEKTRESTEAIRSLVSEIQSATQGSILATEQGSREVDRYRQTIESTADAFREIIGMIERTSEESMQISLATSQQTRANDQVVAGMRQVSEMVRATASQMMASSTSAAELKEMAVSLKNKADAFRV